MLKSSKSLLQSHLQSHCLLMWSSSESKQMLSQGCREAPAPSLRQKLCSSLSLVFLLAERSQHLNKSPVTTGFLHDCLAVTDRCVCPRIFLQFFGPWLYPPRGTMSLWWRQPKCSRTVQARQALHKPHISLSPLSSTGSTGLFDFKQTDKATPLTPAL